MAKILIVPDVHGRAFWHRAMELVDQVDQIVFLGDYLDPYSYEGISFDLALEEFHKILEFKEEYPELVTLLAGNHDFHYLIKDFMDCSRRNYDKLDELHIYSWVKVFGETFDFTYKINRIFFPNQLFL